MNHNLKWSLIVIVLLCWGCSHLSQSPEEDLLDLYQNELALLNDYRLNAAGYLSAQISRFPQTTLQFQKLTREINENFKQMDWKQKIAYQKKWQKRFNPVVKQIELSSRSLLSESAKKLSEAQKAQLSRLKIEISVLQKKSNTVELLPQLFDLETQ